MNLFGSYKSSSSLSEFENPFNKDYFQGVYFWVRKDWKGKIKYSASVTFVNGGTKGEQEIEADNFVDLVKKTEEFIKSL